MSDLKTKKKIVKAGTKVKTPDIVDIYALNSGDFSIVKEGSHYWLQFQIRPCDCRACLEYPVDISHTVDEVTRTAITEESFNSLKKHELERRRLLSIQKRKNPSM